MSVYETVLAEIQRLLLADDGEFDDNHTGDAAKLAKIALLVGLEVTYDEGNRPYHVARPGE